MNKNLVNWKSVACKDIAGEDFPSLLPKILDIGHRGTLLAKILSMPKKNPISFGDAIRMLSEKHSDIFRTGNFGDGPGQFGWYNIHFVNWISGLGYHIELTGDEFEPFTMSDKVA